MDYPRHLGGILEDSRRPLILQRTIKNARHIERDYRLIKGHRGIPDFHNAWISYKGKKLISE